MSNSINKSNVFMFIKAFFFLITLFLGFFLVGCGGDDSSGSSGNIPNTTNAAVPKITVQPSSANYIKGNTANPLSVTATVSDGGTLSYQWYKNSVNSNSGGTPISGETSSSFTPPTSDIGTTYYYVVVTNTNNGVNGAKTANVISATARIVVDVIIITDAQTPMITVQPSSANYIKGNTANSLSVTASVSDGGMLSYQWYKNSVNSNSGGTPISGETSSSFTPPTSDIGTTYYYVVVTNTNNNVNGIKTANITSDTARIVVDILIITDAQIPNITSQPANATYTQGDIAIALNINATVNDGGVLSYQWYSNTINSNQNGIPISGETNSSFTPSTSGMGTTYYYVVVTNTNNNVNGIKTANVSSNTAQIVVDALIITNAATPTITVQPISATYTQGDTAATLNITATVNDGGVLSYQWYKNSVNSNNGGTPISGATNSSFTPSASTIGTIYYYVVVTNTNNNVNGIKTANVSSDTARIAIGYLVSFYDENLDHVVTINAATNIINLPSISNTSNPWYEANSTLPLTADYNLIDDVRLYAVPNVQEIRYQTHLHNIRNNLSGKYILLNSIDLNETGAGFYANG